MKQWLDLTEPMTYEEFLFLAKNAQRGSIQIYQGISRPPVVQSKIGYTNTPIEMETIVRLLDNGIIYASSYNNKSISGVGAKFWHPCISKG